ncbi:hypothetical protein P154DRAFT_567923 [Amniculicola lignicola CBS 123094]|uniref:Cora-domain-containing protein n=1 Tax=Amniculicola lignicola CBS 123094 TaxID=1392246 RepID=A0A6A5VX66_9PLEO|nr:hypothetical protein P154DRAFT_567923 [Amniculicola lignicola CBS 123094]
MDVKASDHEISLSESYNQLEKTCLPVATYKGYVQSLCARNPSLQTLYGFLHNPKARRSDCRINALDFRDGLPQPITRQIPDLDLLPRELRGINDKTFEELSPHRQRPLRGRILVIEDLTVDIIDLIGSTLDIDPLFISLHLHTAHRSSMRHQATDTATLPSRLRPHDYINISYHRPVTSNGNRPSHRNLLRDIAMNRRVTFLRSTNIGLIQSCASVIKIRRPDDIWIALVLVDPPLQETYFLDGNKDDPAFKVTLNLKPYMGPSEDFVELPKFSEPWTSVPHRTRDSIMDDVMDCWSRRNPDCFDPMNPTIQSLAYYPLRIIAAEWVKYIAVMQRCVKIYEYHGQQLPSLERVSTDMGELQGWRRRSMASQQKINTIIRKVQARNLSTSQQQTDIGDLLEDYKVICQDIETAGSRLENMLPVLASLVQIIDARQSFAETANISRLTVLALLFVPLSYVSSLFSMNPDIMPGASRFWLYVAVAVPITIIVFIVARPPIKTAQGIAGWIRGRRRREMASLLVEGLKDAAS